MKKTYKLPGLLLLFSIALTCNFSSPAMAEPVDLLRSIPLEIKGYPESKNLPVTFTSAAQALQAIDSSPVLLMHMEVLRRSYHDLPEAEKDKLMAALLKRHQELESDLPRCFDLGYAKLVYHNNKTGLFYLRKVNDKLQTQFSSLAYAMAEVEADLNHENSTPEEMTTRKMDVMYKLGDAVKFDAAAHQPGFWPTYMRVLEKIRPLAVYESFANRDFTTLYVPYGVPAQNGGQTQIPLKATPETLASNAANTACNPKEDAKEASAVALVNVANAEAPVPIKGSVSSETAVLEYLPTETPGLSRVRVSGAYGQPMLSFETYAKRVVEDLEGDGTYEIVARQYKQDPYNPVIVYRYTSCGFELDKKIFNSFR